LQIIHFANALKSRLHSAFVVTVFMNMHHPHPHVWLSLSVSVLRHRDSTRPEDPLLFSCITDLKNRVNVQLPDQSLS